MKQLKKAALRQFRKRMREEFPPAREMILILQGVHDPVNVGALFRSADAAGVSELILVGDTPRPPHGMIGITSRGADRRVAWQSIPDIETALTVVSERGFTPIALEITDTSVPFFTFSFPDRVALVLGSEGQGVWPKTLALCSAAVCIPQYGSVPSLNVQVAASLVMYHCMLKALV